MRLIQIIPLLIFLAIVSYLIGNHLHDRELQRDQFINSIRLNEHADKPHIELKRVTSPDGRVDAILAEVNMDSSNRTIPKGYAIYLVPVGEGLVLQSLYPNQKFSMQTGLKTSNLSGESRNFLKLSTRTAISLNSKTIAHLRRNTGLRYESFLKANHFLCQNEL